MTATPHVPGRFASIPVVCFALVLPTVVTLAYFVWLKDAPKAAQQTAYAVGKAVQFGLPAVWVLLVERRPPRFCPPSARDFRWGALSGLAIVLPAICVYYAGLKAALPASAVEAIRGKISGLGVGGIPEYLALAAFYSIVHSLLEEYYWRWFVFGQLQRQLAWAAATIVSALGFMAHHVVVLALYFGWSSPLTYAFSAAVAVGGILWAILYHRTGSLWGPWLSHLLVDAGIFFVGYDLVLK